MSQVTRKCDDLGLLVEVKKIPVKEISYKEVHPVAHEERARKYAEAIKKGVPFKPIMVFGKRFEGDTYEVFDGHARVLAYKTLGIEEIEAEITLVDEKGRPRSCK
jgi:ParB-like chromosome segregation protein Spo0J